MATSFDSVVPIKGCGRVFGQGCSVESVNRQPLVFRKTCVFGTARAGRESLGFALFLELAPSLPPVNILHLSTRENGEFRQFGSPNGANHLRSPERPGEARSTKSLVFGITATVGNDDAVNQ